LAVSESNQIASGKSLSRQCLGIVGKIRAVDQVMTPDRQRWIREAHPEVTFAVLSGLGRGLVHRKTTPQGELERVALLPQSAAGVDLAAERTRLGPARVARDDLVDAMACLATAQRVHLGKATIFPEGAPELDGHGLTMEIVA